MLPAVADPRSVQPLGMGLQSGRRPWRPRARSRFLSEWPGARVPEGRRQPFKEVFLCLGERERKGGERERD